MRKGSKPALKGNTNAAGPHKDRRTPLQKAAQSLIGIKRDNKTGKLFIGRSLAAAQAKDRATLKKYKAVK